LRYQIQRYSHFDLGGLNVAVDTSGGHPAMDYTEHNRTYAGFLKFTKISIVLLVLLLAAMKVFLV
jgi:hypothetical protein